MRISDWSSDVCSSDLFLLHFSASLMGILFRAASWRRGSDFSASGNQGGHDGCSSEDDSRVEMPARGERRAAGDCAFCGGGRTRGAGRSEEHTSELQSLMRSSYADLCLKKNTALIR